MGKNGLCCQFLYFFSVLLFGMTFSYAQSPPPNLVAADIGYGNWYHTKEDSTQNVFVTWEREWRGNIANLYDSSGEDVYYPTTRVNYRCLSNTIPADIIILILEHLPHPLQTTHGIIAV